MNLFRISRSLAVGFAAACVTTKQSPSRIDFARNVWRIRIDVDSAPARNPAKEPIFGSVNFTSHHYSVDFWRAINHTLPNAASVTVMQDPRRYRFIFGDSMSFDDKIIMVGQAVTNDSIVGTWTETILCCSAIGRFVLWRPHENSVP